MRLYHLSNVDLGRSVVLTPRLPRDPMMFENRTVPRICVAPSLAGCLLALRGCCYHVPQWLLYVTWAEPVEPVAVPDAGTTGERWLLIPTRFYYARAVPKSLFAACHVADV